ncbi:hypothetical protein K469DRAFT_650476 [Zopfia rhizophila CBS 207.26]|uniref:Heterokaryon incompatibility domain-containing protein n=1 Tax=Zopfia rhizophila CBS 207.26 TaxID=1314779 RepID=A0A6A6EUW8_9PEZI|nr:hypothetical protein K469DRAFT_650476 [Zopfia rhizophila CBS 207.26]
MVVFGCVDTVCIYQHDDEERGTQVMLMRDIYGAAPRVLIWLGETSSKASVGLRELRNLFNTRPMHATAQYLFSDLKGFSEGLRDIFTRP